MPTAIRIVLASTLAWCLMARCGLGQDAMPPTPDPSTPPAPTPEPAAVDPSDPKVMADQIRQLSEMNRKLMEQLGDLSTKYDDLSKKVDSGGKPEAGQEEAGGGGGNAAPGTSGRAGGGGSAGSSGGRSGSSGTSAGGAKEGRGGSSSGENTISRSAGGGGGVRTPESAQGVGNRHLGKLPIKVSYDYDRYGFLFETEDGELQMKFRGLVQADARIYEQRNQNPVASGLSIPRTRWYFSGRMTKPIDYQLTLQDSFGSTALLNAFLNFNYDARLQFRIGRFKTPFTYEFYKLSIYDLYAPERSIFNVNYQGNRQAGAMLWGELLGRKLEYAVGLFSGSRNSYFPTSNSPDVMAFFNAKPFLDTDGPLKHLNLGGSLDYGYENAQLSPAVLRTTQQASTSAIGSVSSANVDNVPFLAFNNNVTEKGIRGLYELHAAYYYKGLSAIASWDNGANSYALTSGTTNNRTNPVSVPVSGYSVQLAYLLTGETRNDFGLIDPLRPFDIRKGKFGLGAIEPTVRFSTIELGDRVFTGGLADPNLWSRTAYMTDTGFNWYLNDFTKVYFDWNHVEFGQPVYYRPGPGLQKTSDLFWFRFQLFF